MTDMVPDSYWEWWFRQEVMERLMEHFEMLDGDEDDGA